MSKKSIAVQQQERKAKGRALAARGHVVELLAGWSVLGDAHKVYLVTFRYPTTSQPALYDCACEDYARHAQQLTCKHGEAVEAFRQEQSARMNTLYSLAPEREPVTVLAVAA
jgi:hypothetical protein